MNKQELEKHAREVELIASTKGPEAAATAACEALKQIGLDLETPVGNTLTQMLTQIDKSRQEAKAIVVRELETLGLIDVKLVLDFILLIKVTKDAKWTLKTRSTA